VSRARSLVVAAALAIAVVTPSRSEAEGPPAPIELGRFRTTYLDDAEHKPRAFNLELASEAIDKKTILAGAVFSFNDAVGERTATFGFARAVVLRDRMIAEGTGGGTCQVASTLHAAALLAGLEITVRAPHTRPSAYIRMGLDATVAFPRIDLKIKNPTAGAVTVHARARGGNLDVWFDTAASDGVTKPKVSVTTEIVERTRFERLVERDRTIKSADEVRLDAFGIPGYTVRRTRTITTSDGTFRRDLRTDVYPPTNAVVRVASGFDAGRLAPRPEGGRDGEDEDAPPSVVVRSVAPTAVRPLAVQLRPSTTVTIDNGT
jgi:vancomycin resistance protein YoaR